MRALDHLSPCDRISGAWCNSNVVVTAILEAMSFATPPLERFFIRAVRDAMADLVDPGKAARARAFVEEEARHSRAHRRFNEALASYLGGTPPGLRQVEAVLDFASSRLPLSVRMTSVEVMEQGSALGSAAWLWCEQRLTFDCPFARHLFAQHAREELGHAVVIHELCDTPPATARLAMAAACAVIAAAGITYLAVAVPWIVLRKARARRSKQESSR